MSEPTLTRRGLLRGIGTAAVVAGCAKEGSLQSPSDAAGNGSDAARAKRLSFVLDDERKTIDVEPRTTLLDLLRIDLDKTGVKVVCDRGACGACMVLVDGVPKNSCMLLAHDVEGSEVVTVHGLAKTGDRLSALQAAFVEHDALQCGFCTSGMLISCEALLRRNNGSCDADEVRRAIAGNLCRCGTYPHVVKAVLAVAGDRGQGGGV